MRPRFNCPYRISDACDAALCASPIPQLTRPSPSFRNFDGPHVFLPDQAREGIVNALVHRDYSIQGAKCQLVATPDTIVIKSPGGTVAPITLEQMRTFTAPMLSRNPALHFVFAQMKLAEERGLGLKSLKARAQSAGLPLPAYSWDDPYLVLTIYRSPQSASRTLRPDVREKLNKDSLAAWEHPYPC